VNRFIRRLGKLDAVGGAGAGSVPEGDDYIGRLDNVVVASDTCGLSVLMPVG